jgi:hypothetical protein
LCFPRKRVELILFYFVLFYFCSKRNWPSDKQLRFCVLGRFGCRTAGFAEDRCECGRPSSDHINQRCIRAQQNPAAGPRPAARHAVRHAGRQVPSPDEGQAACFSCTSVVVVVVVVDVVAVAIICQHMSSRVYAWVHDSHVGRRGVRHTVTGCGIGPD